jgi:hypothetical protein
MSLAVLHGRDVIAGVSYCRERERSYSWRHPFSVSLQRQSPPRGGHSGGSPSYSANNERVKGILFPAQQEVPADQTTHFSAGN